MSDFEVIDVHVHLTRSMSEEEKRMIIPGRRRRDRWATPQTAIFHMDLEGISKAAVMYLPPLPPRGLILGAKGEKISQPILTGQNKQESLPTQIGQLLRQFNQWGCEVEQKFPRLVTFICIAPDLGDSKDMVQELVLRVRKGAKGVKLHPGLFHFFPNDKRLWPIYRQCQELGLPILADSAPSPGFHILSAWRTPVPKMSFEYGEPSNFAQVLENFPHLTLILAHLGSAYWDERVELAKKFPNVYFDTSQGFVAPDQIPYNPRRGLAEEDAVRIIRKIGVERIMFGSDGPALDREPQLEQLLRLPLNNREKQMILSKNAKEILHI
jgi:hypothetical protein